MRNKISIKMILAGIIEIILGGVILALIANPTMPTTIGIAYIVIGLIVLVLNKNNIVRIINICFASLMFMCASFIVIYSITSYGFLNYGFVLLALVIVPFLIANWIIIYLSNRSKADFCGIRSIVKQDVTMLKKARLEKRLDAVFSCISYPLTLVVLGDICRMFGRLFTDMYISVSVPWPQRAFLYVHWQWTLLVGLILGVSSGFAAMYLPNCKGWALWCLYALLVIGMFSFISWVVLTSGIIQIQPG